MRAIDVSPYRSGDREQIRRLCCDVAYAGQPLERWIDLDRELFADLFTRYYTDFEPSSVFVARDKDEVLGYVFACLNTARYRRVWRRHVVLPALGGIVTGRYALPWKGLPRLMNLGISYVRSGCLKVPWRRYPGHVHINTAPACRGRTTLSRALMHRAFDHFASHGVFRIHGVVMTSRARMLEKYERLGFKVDSSHGAARPDPKRNQAFWLVLTMDLAKGSLRPMESVHMRRRGTLRRKEPTISCSLPPSEA
ncbi:hypothetical protein JXA88_03270 [Candidatus Fermentibacteria bacterium]|nr:hypothetical protein [Candidatus Fermentibacteria bacterium]